MKKCKSCQKEIDDKASKCPYCQTDLRSWFRRHPILTVLIGLFIIPPFLGGLFSTNKKGVESEPKSQQETQKQNRQTQASVNFTGTKFIITNRNNFDWDRVEIIVNEKYRYEIGGMKAGSTYEVGAGQLTDNKNNRFNPLEVKPAEIRIYVKQPMSDDWYGDLN